MPAPLDISTVPTEVDRLLALAQSKSASDLHLEPLSTGYEARLRIDGILLPESTYPTETGRALITRLMVLAKLLTYRTDIPQEGRFTISVSSPKPLPPGEVGCTHPGEGSTAPKTLNPSAAATAGQPPAELRLSIMPTAKGLRAAIRLPTTTTSLTTPPHLSLTDSALKGIHQFLHAPAGLLIITGPAGSGKTTLSYAILAELLRLHPGQSIVTLEDPVERHLDGITQIEATPFGQLTYDRALRSMLRQDPQILMLGEVRDPDTAQLAAQAALSGHRMIATLHAANTPGAIRRLLDLGIAPHALASSLLGACAIRLLRRKVGNAYQGRIPVTEFATLTPPLRTAILNNADLADLQSALTQNPHHQTLQQTAQSLITANLTDAPEVERVLGVQ